jgi:hypothetical protein
MKKFLPLLLCLLFSIFTVARATKPAHTPALNTKTAQNKPRGQEADAKTLFNDANTDEEPISDEGEDMNDNDGGDAPGDEDTGDDDAGDDDGGDDGGGDEGE